MTRYIDGGTIDLDSEEFYLADGTRLTEEMASELAEEMTQANRRGRPSLSSADGRSPQISVRVSTEVRDRLRGRAQDEGKRLSDVVREALAAYVSR